MHLDKIREFKIPLPPISVQSAIASFLDRETTKITSIISAKTKLIEKLKEKRNNIISHAVTKGLDPNVKMKPSGIEWIGDIPEEWELSKVKFEFYNLDSKRIPLNSIERSSMDKTYDYYGASGVIDKVDAYLFNEKLILIGEDGANLIARSTSLAFIAQGKYWVNNHAHILKPYKRNSIYYMTYQLELNDFSVYVSGSAQPKLTQEQLADLRIVVPSTNEQTAIANYLDSETLRMDAIIEKTQTSIKKLKEYQTALISAAVTGKIDVRCEVL